MGPLARHRAIDPLVIHRIFGLGSAHLGVAKRPAVPLKRSVKCPLILGSIGFFGFKIQTLDKIIEIWVISVNDRCHVHHGHSRREILRQQYCNRIRRMVQWAPTLSRLCVRSIRQSRGNCRQWQGCVGRVTYIGEDAQRSGSLRRRRACTRRTGTEPHQRYPHYRSTFKWRDSFAGYHRSIEDYRWYRRT
ncbi:hypothetical protein V1280_008642 [Bradyrhizobium sp. AZCC 2230]